MFRKFATSLLTAAMVVSLAACGSTQSQSETTSETEISTQETQTDNTQEVESTEEASYESSETETADTEAADTENTETSVTLGAVANDLAEDEEALVDTYADLFEQLTYTDEETGLSITYNLYLPEGYDESQEYPMVVFIGDSSCAGTDATYSLTQGRGGLVWATEEWQSAYPSIVVVPTYPETILDDHGSYTTTEYVELTKRFIDYMTEEYSVDSDRIYGTGQSMGCMTTLILASEYPDLYAACMFVDGQWDGTWSVDELSEAATELFSGESTNAYFISWASGTIDASTGNSAAGSGDMGSMSGGFGGPSSSEDSSSEDSSQEFTLPEDGSAPEGMSGDFAGPSDSKSGEMSGDMSSSGTNSSAYHMASFDYAYNCVAVMEWLFQQTNE